MSARGLVPGARLTPVVLVADAGPDVGFGHLMRCIALAEGLRERGTRAEVLMADNPIDAPTLQVIARGVPVRRVPAERPFVRDAKAVLSVIDDFKPELAITDVSTQPALQDTAVLDAFHSRVKQKVPFLAAFAAGSHVDPSADLVISPYVLPEPAHVRSGRVLWGPQYFVFRPEFIRAAAAPRVIEHPVRRVLVAVGGSDPAQLTPRILTDLSAVAGTGVEVQVVAGPGFGSLREDLASQVRQQGARWRVIDPPEDMAQLFRWADVAITGDGLTKYETAVTATPSIIVERPDSNHALNVAFTAAGSTICVTAGASRDWPHLRATIERVVADRDLRRELSSRGRALTDGGGLRRVLDELPLVKVA